MLLAVTFNYLQEFSLGLPRQLFSDSWVLRVGRHLLFHLLGFLVGHALGVLGVDLSDEVAEQLDRFLVVVVYWELGGHCVTVDRDYGATFGND